MEKDWEKGGLRPPNRSSRTSDLSHILQKNIFMESYKKIFLRNLTKKYFYGILQKNIFMESYKKNSWEKNIFAIFGFWEFSEVLRISIRKNTFLLSSENFWLSQNEKKSKIAKKMPNKRIKWLSVDNRQKNFFPAFGRKQTDGELYYK